MPDLTTIIIGVIVVVILWVILKFLDGLEGGP